MRWHSDRIDLCNEFDIQYSSDHDLCFIFK